MSLPSDSCREFMLLFRDSTPDAYQAMSAEERQRLLNEWNAWYNGLAAETKMQHGRPLEPEGRVVSVVRGRVVDGPFTESKEAIGGYFLVLADGLEEAVAIARQCPSLPHGLVIEVRPVGESCHTLNPTRMEAMSMGHQGQN